MVRSLALMTAGTAMFEVEVQAEAVPKDLASPEGSA